MLLVVFSWHKPAENKSRFDCSEVMLRHVGVTSVVSVITTRENAAEEKDVSRLRAENILIYLTTNNSLNTIYKRLRESEHVSIKYNVSQTHVPCQQRQQYTT